ncbi:MAG: ribosome small subunit-dependent GTPase A [Bacteroidales bacterium]|nr:ribosome small subunit-dependent GTPase A [Bacteroidales bacterium]MCM1148068.1 ribosome small subunit-dependent GTPase A [Bacteroidales bacterium]MCM1207161.1 ribosome small subunit-dependent GTPase A [Bacillota bacterium]MCM1509477.1 ribosome small subunit-dependent GTPase A [Clostridium sp.]
MQGLVIKNTGYWYTVLTDEGSTVDCKIKGSFRLKGIRSTNPVAVGDRVKITEPTQNTIADKTHSTGDMTAFITEIEDRRNYIIRKSQNLSKASHILAANVDQAVLVVTVNHPQTSTTFIDRFLASAEAYSVPVILAFNKKDLLSEEELHYQEMMMTLYETIGYKCIALSALHNDGIDELARFLNDKITLFSGNSGVGKSTILNTILPGANLRTAEISDAHNTGMHTTTFSEMLPIGTFTAPEQEDDETRRIQSPCPAKAKGWLIDTPGIKGFGTFDMEPEEICSYFKEIFRFSKDCRFNNCTHTHEPGCAVRKALEEHYISESRYNSYLSMLNDKEDGKYREAF